MLSDIEIIFYQKKREKKARENGNGLHFNQSQQTRTTLDCSETKNTPVKTTADTYDNLGHDVGQAQNVRR